MPFAPPTHRSRAPSHQTQIERAADKARGTARARGYDTKWEKARRAFLAVHPLCAEHARHDRVEPATCVDHIVPHRGDRKLFWDRKNWQSLCTPCHSAKTGRGA